MKANVVAAYASTHIKVMDNGVKSRTRSPIPTMAIQDARLTRTALISFSKSFFFGSFQSAVCFPPFAVVMKAADAIKQKSGPIK